MKAIEELTQRISRGIGIIWLILGQVIAVEAINPGFQFLGIIVNLLAGRLQTLGAIILEQIKGICDRSNGYGLIQTLGKRLHRLKPLGKHERDDQIGFLEPTIILIESDETLLHIALVVHQVGIQLFHHLGLVEREVQLA